MLFFFFLMIRRPPRSTLSLHDALPISRAPGVRRAWSDSRRRRARTRRPCRRDRKSTRLNSSHMSISYAVFCLKKKKQDNDKTEPVQLPDTDHHLTAGTCEPRQLSEDYY